jgi:histone deacetylase-like protein
MSALMGGEAAAASAGTRPPGRHARREATSGFSLFDNVAVAARHALGARRIFNFARDIHHGDGINDIFRASDAVLFASIHQARIFPGQDLLTRCERSLTSVAATMEALAGDEPPEMVAPDFHIGRAPSYIGHHRNHGGNDRLDPARVGDAEHGHLRDLAQEVDRPFDLAARDVSRRQS